MDRLLFDIWMLFIMQYHEIALYFVHFKLTSTYRKKQMISSVLRFNISKSKIYICAINTAANADMKSEVNDSFSHSNDKIRLLILIFKKLIMSVKTYTLRYEFLYPERFTFPKLGMTMVQ